MKYIVTTSGILITDGTLLGEKIIDGIEKSFVTGDASTVAIQQANSLAEIADHYMDITDFDSWVKNALTSNYSEVTKIEISVLFGIAAEGFFISGNPTDAVTLFILGLITGNLSDTAYDIYSPSLWAALRNTRQGFEEAVDAVKAATNPNELEQHLKELFPNIFDFLKSLNDLGHWLGQNLPTTYDIEELTNRLYLQARGLVLPHDPLALDLDGDGIETIATGTVVFDHDGDGLKTGTGWLKGDDGWLVWDKNGNGNIDSGRELFGEDYVKNNGQKAASGFDALSDLDSNQDGLFSSLDSPFNSVRVWRDLNQDGISQANELNTLSQLNIASISLSSTAYALSVGNGNVQTAQGNFTRTDGSTGKAVNLDLSNNPFYRDFTDSIDTSAAASLPDMQGSGAVRDLREAAAQSTALKDRLSSVAQSANRSQLMAALPGLLDAWADAANYSDSFELANADQRKMFFVPPGVSVLDAYNAQFMNIFGSGYYHYTDLNGNGKPESSIDTPQFSRYQTIRKTFWLAKTATS